MSWLLRAQIDDACVRVQTKLNKRPLVVPVSLSLSETPDASARSPTCCFVKWKGYDRGVSVYDI